MRARWPPDARSDHPRDRRNRGALLYVAHPLLGRTESPPAARADGELGDKRAAQVEAAVADLGNVERPLLHSSARSEQVDDLDPSCCEQVGDQSSVTAPRQRLGAHEARVVSAERVGEGVLPFARRHPRRVASEGGNAEAPESVLPGDTRTSAAEVRRMQVGDGGGLQLERERSLAELRIAPRAGEATDVDQCLHPGLVQGCDELVRRLRAVSDRRDAHPARRLTAAASRRSRAPAESEGRNIGG